MSLDSDYKNPGLNKFAYSNPDTKEKIFIYAPNMASAKIQLNKVYGEDDGIYGVESNAYSKPFIFTDSNQKVYPSDIYTIYFGKLKSGEIKCTFQDYINDLLDEGELKEVNESKRYEGDVQMKVKFEDTEIEATNCGNIGAYKRNGSGFEAPLEDEDDYIKWAKKNKNEDHFDDEEDEDLDTIYEDDMDINIDAGDIGDVGDVGDISVDTSGLDTSIITEDEDQGDSVIDAIVNDLDPTSDGSVYNYSTGADLDTIEEADNRTLTMKNIKGQTYGTYDGTKWFKINPEDITDVDSSKTIGDGSSIVTEAEENNNNSDEENTDNNNEQQGNEQQNNEEQKNNDQNAQNNEQTEENEEKEDNQKKDYGNQKLVSLVKPEGIKTKISNLNLGASQVFTGDYDYVIVFSRGLSEEQTQKLVNGFNDYYVYPQGQIGGKRYQFLISCQNSNPIGSRSEKRIVKNICRANKLNELNIKKKGTTENIIYESLHIPECKKSVYEAYVKNSGNRNLISYFQFKDLIEKNNKKIKENLNMNTYRVYYYDNTGALSDIKIKAKDEKEAAKKCKEKANSYKNGFKKIKNVDDITNDDKPELESKRRNNMRRTNRRMENLLVTDMAEKTDFNAITKVFKALQKAFDNGMDGYFKETDWGCAFGSQCMDAKLILNNDGSVTFKGKEYWTGNSKNPDEVYNETYSDIREFMNSDYYEYMTQGIDDAFESRRRNNTRKNNRRMESKRRTNMRRTNRRMESRRRMNENFGLGMALNVLKDKTGIADTDDLLCKIDEFVLFNDCDPIFDEACQEDFVAFCQNGEDYGSCDTCETCSQDFGEEDFENFGEEDFADEDSEKEDVTFDDAIDLGDFDFDENDEVEENEEDSIEFNEDESEEENEEESEEDEEEEPEEEPEKNESYRRRRYNRYHR